MLPEILSNVVQQASLCDWTTISFVIFHILSLYSRVEFNVNVIPRINKEESVKLRIHVAAYKHCVQVM